MFGHRVDQVDTISQRGEPAGVRAGSAAGVDHGGGHRRQMAQDQFLSACLFELKPSGAQARGFVGVVIVTNDFGDGIVVGHDWPRSLMRGAVEVYLIVGRLPGFRKDGTRCAELTAPGLIPREISVSDGNKTIAGWFTLVCVPETSLPSGSFEELAMPHFERL